MPAVALLGDIEPNTTVNVLDTCAAPGNKTTHLAAIFHEKKLNGSITGMDRSQDRFGLLQRLVSSRGGDGVIECLFGDFLEMDDSRFKNVTHVLCDPSCSGSGMVERRDGLLKVDEREKERLKALSEAQIRIVSRAMECELFISLFIFRD